jgi:hypothetical protein
MISTIRRLFRENAWTWNIKGKGSVVPDEDDIERALDLAAEMLYSESIGTRLSVGRLIIEKTHQGHDVYCFVGNYK